MDRDHPPPTSDHTMRYVESLLPDDMTVLTSNSNASISSVTLTQNVMRKYNTNPNAKIQQQFILSMVAAESMSDIFPEWLNFAFSGPPTQRKYRPYDLNMPLAIPRRPEVHYKFDPPLTEHGKVTASVTAMGLLRNRLPFKVIYCAPEMVAVMTANTVSLASKKHPVPIRIEPALANWRGFSKDQQQYFESKHYYAELGYNIDLSYKPFRNESQIPVDESPQDYLQRSVDFFVKIVDENAYDCVLIIGHAGTVHMAADGSWDTKTKLLDIERAKVPCAVHGIHLGADGEHSHLSRPTLPFTPTLFDAQEKAKKTAIPEEEKPKKRFVKSFGASASEEQENFDVND